MPPRKNAGKSATQTDSELQDPHAARNGESSQRRPQRTRKLVDYNEDRLTSSKGDSDEDKPKGRKVTKKQTNKIQVNRDSSPENEINSEDSVPDETLEEATNAAKKPSGKVALNETFVMPKKKTAAKGNKRNVKDIEESDELPATKKPKDGNEKLNKTDTDYSQINFSNNKTTASGEEWNLKITSWNVDGLRSWLKKNGSKFLEYEKPDILCLQETKCSENKLPPEVKFEGYHCYWASAEKEGYSGVALFSKEEPIDVKYGIGIEEHDSEGRLITAEYEKFYLVTTYVPNAGRGLVTLPKRLLWDAEFRKYLKQLDSEKPVIICGDMNVSHQEIDLANPKTNTKNAGFTQEERDGMTELLSQGFIDTFRHIYPDKTGAYTFWTYMRGARGRNIGWRLDYFIVSERILGQVCDNVIRHEVLGSDHCPITLLFHNK